MHYIGKEDKNQEKGGRQEESQAPREEFAKLGFFPPFYLGLALVVTGAHKLQYSCHFFLSSPDSQKRLVTLASGQ